MHQPDRHEAHPAQARQAKKAVIVVGRQLRPHGSEQYAQHDGRQVGLDTEPGDGDHRPDQRRYLRAVDAEGDATDHRKGYAGFLCPDKFMKKYTSAAPIARDRRICQPPRPRANNPMAKE